MSDFDRRLKALGKLGRTKGGRAIISAHREAICSILGACAAKEAKHGQ